MAKELMCISVTGLCCIGLTSILLVASLTTQTWDILSVKVDMKEMIPVLKQLLKTGESENNLENVFTTLVPFNEAEYGNYMNSDQSASNDMSSLMKNNPYLKEMETIFESGMLDQLKDVEIKEKMVIGLKKICMKPNIKGLDKFPTLHNAMKTKLIERCFDTDFIIKVDDIYGRQMKSIPVLKIFWESYMDKVHALIMTQNLLYGSIAFSALALIFAFLKLPMFDEKYRRAFIAIVLILCFIAACSLVAAVIHFHKEIEMKKLYDNFIDTIKAAATSETSEGPTVSAALSMLDSVKFHEEKGYSFFLTAASVPLILIAFAFNLMELIMVKNPGTDGYQLWSMKTMNV